MRLAFNATALLSPFTGIGQYSFQLATNMLSKEIMDINFFYGAIWDQRLRQIPSRTIGTALPILRQYMPFGYEIKTWLQNYYFHKFSNPKNRKKKFDIYHEPSILPLRFDGPTVITIHDLAWIRHPETHPVQRVRALNRYFEKGLGQAHAIITPSRFVKNELIELFSVPAELIYTIPLGVEPQFKPMQVNQTRSLLDRRGLRHGQYILVVGTMEPRKNIALVVRAYLQLPKKLRIAYPLVLVGINGWCNTMLMRQLDPLISSGEVRQLGYVPRSELAVLMAGALTLVYPSIYEGFGLPILESMACGVPVISSNTSSLPELVGDTGVLIKPEDDHALKVALLRMVNDEHWRLSQSKKSWLRAQSLTWSRCADSTIDVYRTIL
jgi:glycosyltransferase involved in cell wall biosynthesis